MIGSLTKILLSLVLSFSALPTCKIWSPSSSGSRNDDETGGGGSHPFSNPDTDDDDDSGGGNDGTNPPSSGGPTGDRGDPRTPSGSGASLIASTGKVMSWPTTAGTCRDRATGNYITWKPSTSYRNSSDAPCLNTNSDYLMEHGQTRLIQDCGKFVGLVIRNSVDSSFPASGVRNQIPYMNRSSNWTKVSTDGQIFSWSNLKPGDIIAVSENGHGHIMIWIGEQSVRCGSSTCTVNVASSSQGTRSPSLNKISKMKYCYDGGQTCIPYKVYRWTGA